jgi:long-chain fatty acid transport protein
LDAALRKINRRREGEATVRCDAGSGLRALSNGSRRASNEDRNAVKVALVRTPIALAVAACAFTCVPAFSAGFLLNETSASGLGIAFAGGAAAAQDASTLWSNPAGMSKLRGSQLVGAIHVITPSMTFNDQASLKALNQSTLGGNGGDAGGSNFVPNLYFAMPINPTWSFGVGFTAPWGLVTEYEAGWTGRFQALKSSIKTYNLNPAFSWKAAPEFAVGLGLNLQRLEGEFTNQVNYSGALISAGGAGVAPLTPNLESSALIKGADNSSGWNIGLLWDLDANTRLGFGYRSRVNYTLTGNVTFTNPAPSSLPAAVQGLATAVNAGALYNSGISSDVKIPEIANLSYFRTMGSWDLMADAQWTRWSSIQSLTFMRDSGKLLQSTPENFKDVWKLALGFNYRQNDQWMWRGGLAYDQSPVQSAYRTPRLPDADRTWLTGGGQYKINHGFKFDFGAAYLWVKDGSINTPADAAGQAAYGLLNGKYTGRTWILSGQGTWSF